jgi:hypothetical protein
MNALNHIHWNRGLLGVLSYSLAVAIVSCPLSPLTVHQQHAVMLVLLPVAMLLQITVILFSARRPQMPEERTIGSIVKDTKFFPALGYTLAAIALSWLAVNALGSILMENIPRVSLYMFIRSLGYVVVAALMLLGTWITIQGLTKSRYRWSNVLMGSLFVMFGATLFCPASKELLAIPLSVTSILVPIFLYYRFSRKNYFESASS